MVLIAGASCAMRCTTFNSSSAPHKARTDHQFPALIRIGLGVALLPYLCRKLGIERCTAVIEHKRLGK